MMNRETSFRTSDTLVVTDRSRQRRWLIIGAVFALLVIVGALLMFMTAGSSKKAAEEAAAGAGQVPTVTVIVPGRSQVAGMVTASGPLAAKRDQPVGIAGSGGRVVRVLVDAGTWVRAGQTLAIVDRSVQAQEAAQLAAQIQAARANAALAQSNYERALALQGRGFVSKAEIDSKKRFAMPPSPRFGWPRRSSARRGPKSAG
jgi:multidrug efflux pump subunit AcrA (membrane-fusion protein)